MAEELYKLTREGPVNLLELRFPPQLEQTCITTLRRPVISAAIFYGVVGRNAVRNAKGAQRADELDKMVGAMRRKIGSSRSSKSPADPRG